jgi:hypothetical protein
MELHELLPFLVLPNIHSLYTLAICTYDFNFNYTSLPDLHHLKGTSKVKFLAWDEADIAFADAIKKIVIPKALERFRWSRQFWCTYSATCHGPFQNLIGKAPLAHKESLKTLDLDIRHHYCSGQRHQGNPQREVEEDEYYKTRTFPNPKDRKMPRDAILIGSLKEFSALNELSMDVISLCGHQSKSISDHGFGFKGVGTLMGDTTNFPIGWVPAPVRMLDVLPLNLETLKL